MGICETEQGSIVEPLGKMAEEQDENVEAPSKEELQDAAEEEFANVSRPPRIPFRSGSSYPPHWCQSLTVTLVTGGAAIRARAVRGGRV